MTAYSSERNRRRRVGTGYLPHISDTISQQKPLADHSRLGGPHQVQILLRHINGRGASTSDRCFIARDLCGNVNVQLALYLAQPLVSNAECHDNNESQNERPCTANVPLAKDDTGVDHLAIPEPAILSLAHEIRDRNPLMEQGGLGVRTCSSSIWLAWACRRVRHGLRGGS